MHARLPLALVALVALVSGCAGPNPLVNTAGTHGVAGFWAGVWHGLICFVTFLISLFDQNVHMYEVHNNGTWYNLGFLLGASTSLGGIGRSSRRR
jgi:hypothetical protein